MLAVVVRTILSNYKSTEECWKAQNDCYEVQIQISYISEFRMLSERCESSEPNLSITHQTYGLFIAQTPEVFEFLKFMYI